jgi:hypothetical protein
MRDGYLRPAFGFSEEEREFRKVFSDEQEIVSTQKENAT